MTHAATDLSAEALGINAFSSVYDKIRVPARFNTGFSAKTIDEILSDVSQEHGISIEDIKSHRRKKTILAARTELFARLSEKGFSDREMGVAMGRDRSTFAKYRQRMRGAV